MVAADFANLIQAVSSSVLALFTVVLAIATWRYYKQSKLQTDEISHQTDEMVRTRKLRNEPQLKAGITPFHGPNWCIKFTNIGGGIAQDVHANYWIDGIENSEREWGTQIHFPEDMYSIGFPLEEGGIGVTGLPDEIRSHFEDSDDTLIVEWTYEDSSGNKFEHRQEMSILDKIAERADSDEFYLGNEREVRF